MLSGGRHPLSPNRREFEMADTTNLDRLNSFTEKLDKAFYLIFDAVEEYRDVTTDENRDDLRNAMALLNEAQCDINDRLIYSKLEKYFII